ncbi:LamG-like jellyroll fold domain-containing protein [Kitasatospora sp. NPDC057692]|uniref:LamG-like jellyroll fold domain-containing protein n=1 Tax=Kitasatospora sp. NPDC057692 TaxID=3346215 RepID=UPI0036AC0297
MPATQEASAFTAANTPSPTVTPKTPQQLGGDPSGGTHTVPSDRTDKDAAAGEQPPHQPGQGELAESRPVPGDTTPHRSADTQPRSPVEGKAVTPPPLPGHRPGEPSPGGATQDPAETGRPAGAQNSPSAANAPPVGGDAPGTGIPGLPVEGVEVTGARTDTTAVFRNPDGTKTLRVYPRPVHYQKDDGTWENINTNLTLDQAGRWSEQANSQRATFAARGDDPALVSWVLDAEHLVSYGLRDAAPVLGVVDGDKVTYPLARPASDVVYNGLAQGIKESLVLHDATAPTSWVFPLRTTGLTAAIGPDGEVRFTDAAGVVRLSIPHGYMMDSKIDPASGDGALSDGVTYQLIDVDGAPALRMDLDEAWLHDTRRVFPVTVDPSTTTGSVSVGQSTFVRSDATANFSTDPLLRIGTADGGASKVNSYLYFPGVATALPHNYLHAVTLNLNNVHSYECSPHPVYVNQITSWWNPATINRYPGLDIGQQLGTNSFSAGDTCGGPMWKSIDLGSDHNAPGVQLVESWARGGTNYGLALTASTTDSWHWKKFSSANTNYPPYLSIVFSDWAATYSPSGSYMPPTYNTPGYQQVSLTNIAANWWNGYSMQVKARIFDENWNEQWFNAPLTGVSGLVKTYETVTVNGVIPPLPLGRSYILCWDGYVNGTVSLHDGYAIPFGTCTWVSGVNTAPQMDMLAPLSNTVVGSLTPQLYGTGHDPDNYPGWGLDYLFRVYTNPSSGDPQLIVDSGWQPSTSWAVPPGKLAWNTSYLWNVKVGDHSGESPLTSSASFSTQVQQPVITSHLGAAVGDGAGRPFDAQVGNYTTAATDAEVRSVGPALAVNRSYNSLDPRTSTLFGNGWTSNFDMRVQPDNDGTESVVLTTGSGRAARFGADPNSGAVFTPPPGEYQSLSRVPAGFDLMAKGGTRYEFHAVSGSGYALSAVRDAVGRLQELGYVDGRLATVTDVSSGRTLHFEWTADQRHVAKVYTDPVTGSDWSTSLTWTYSYNATDPDQLDQVCAPPTGGNTAMSCTTYSYIRGSHLRSAVLDSGPVSYWRLGESQGNVAASEVVENQGNDNAWYSGTGVTLGTPGPTASAATAATFDGSSGYVSLPQSVLDTSSYTSVGLWFKTTGWGVLFSYQADTFPGTGSTPANYTPALFVGQSGKLHGKLWNGPSNTIDSANPVNDGQWHFALLSAAGSTQTLYLDGEAQGTLSGAVVAPGQRSEAVGGGFLSAGWPDNPYGWPGQANFFSGSISDVVFYNRTLGAPAVSALWQAGHRSSAELSGLKLPSGKTSLAVTYDTVKDRAAKVTDENGGTWTLNAPTVAGSAQEYRGEVMASRPAGYWRLSEGAGVQANNQIFTPRPTPNNGTYSNVSLGAAGPMAGSAGAATFDGTTSWAELPASFAPQSGPGAIGLWFRADRPGALLSYQSFRIGGSPNGTTDRWNPALYIGADGRLRAQLWMGDAAKTMVTSGTVTDGQWHFAVLSADSQTSQRLYLDGAQAAGPLEGAITPNGTGHVFLGAGAVFGGWPDPAADPAGHFKGQIADVAVYPHGLSAAVVAAQHQLATTAGAAQYDAAVVDANPTGYWRLGDAAGNQAAELISSAALAENRGSYHETQCCQPGPWASGTGTATGFNGSTSHVRLPDNTAPKHWGAATVELWFRTSAPGVLYGYQSFPVGGSPNGSTDRWNPALYVGSDGRLYGTLWTGSADYALVSPSTVTDGAWHHVALAGDGSGQSLYLDGAEAATVTAARPISYNGSAYAYLGAGFTGGGWLNRPADVQGHFNGAIADFAIFQYRLGKGAITDQYRRATSTPVGGLDAASAYRASVVQDNAVGYWRLDDPAGSGYAASQLGFARPDVTAGDLTDVTLNSNGPSGDPAQRAAEFNGSTSRIRLPDDAAPIRGAASIELWFRTTSGGPLYSYQDFPVGSSGNSWNPALYVGSDGRIHGEFWMGPGATMVSDRTVNDGRWHQVVLTGDDQGQTIYLDGRPSASDNTGRKITFNGTPYVYLGAGTTTNWPAADRDHFSGAIAEVSYYASRLDAETVASHFESMGDGTGGVPVTTATVGDPSGYNLVYRYDTRSSRLISRADGYGNTTRYSYDTSGFLHAVTDPNGHTITTGHDARGNTVSRTTCRSAGSCQTSYATYYLDSANPFNPANDKLLSSSDGRSQAPWDTTYTTRYSYDAYGQLVSTTTPATPDFPQGRIVHTIRTDATTQAEDGGSVPAGLVRAQSESLDAGAYPTPASVPADRQTVYTFRHNGDVAAVQSPLRPKTEYTYDGLGRPATSSSACADCPNSAVSVGVVGPRVLTTTYAWDGQGNQTSGTEPYTTDAITGTKHTRRTVLAYDVDGNPTSQTVSDLTGGDPPRTFTWTYEAGTSRVKEVKDAGGHVTAYSYDRYGNVVTRTDAAGTTYNFSYSPMGQLQQTAIANYTGSTATPVSPRWQVIGSRAYDPAGRLATDTDGMGRTTHSYYYDDNTLAEVDLDGYRNADGSVRNVVLQQNTYDNAGHLVQQVTGGGRTTVVTGYDAADRVTSSIVDPGGLNRGTVYTYDASDRPLRVVSTGGTESAEVEFVYDAGGNLVKETARNQPADSVTVHGYNSRGLRTSTVSPNGNVTGADPTAFTSTTAYDEAGRPTVATGPLVSAETFDQAAGSSTAQQVRPIMRSGYNTFGELTAATDALGGTVTHTYDADGNRVGVAGVPYTDPQSGTTTTPTATMGYDALGRMVTATVDPGGLNLTRTNRYDQFGNVVQSSLPKTGTTAAPVITRSYDLAGELLSATGPTGASVQSTYDDLGRRITSTQLERFPTPTAHTTTYTWDDADNQLSSTLPSGATTRSTYNAVGQVLTTTDPAGLTVRTDYDGLGRTGRVTGADGTATVSSHDRLGRTLSTTDLDTTGAVTGVQYSTFDPEGQLLTATDKVTNAADAAAHATRFGYDPAGRLVQQVEPVAAGQTITTSFGYDAGGRKTRWTNGKGVPVHYTHNTLGLQESTIEPATAAHPAQADRRFTAGYDVAGRAITLTEPGGVVRHRVFDGVGNLLRETATGAEAATADRVLGYDAAGRLTSVGTPGGTSDTYTYNDRDQLLTSAGPGGSSAYGYDADGRLTARTDAAGTTAFGYNTAGQLRSTTDPLTATTVGYDYDATGRLTTERYGSGGGTRSYTYDNSGRLRDDIVRNSGGGTVSSIGYGYDPNGRVTSKTTTGTAGASVNAYTYDLAGRLTSWNNGTADTAYGWDAAGNRTSAGGRTATYDERNELLTEGTTSYTYTARGTLSGSTVQGSQPKEVRFDGFGRMVKEGPSTFTYDGLDRVAQAGAASFSYDGGSNDLVSDGAAVYSRSPSGRLLGTAAVGAVPAPRLLVSDRHSDVVAALDPSTQGLTGSTAYDPFGKPAASAGTTGPLGYQGGWTDPASGDVNMAARWYRPGSGTFASRDSWQIGATPSVQGNRFTYGNGDPVNSTDPSGHCGWCHAVAAIVEAIVFATPAAAPTCSANPEKCYGRQQTAQEAYCESHSYLRSCGGEGYSPRPQPAPQPPPGPVVIPDPAPAPPAGGGGSKPPRTKPAPPRTKPAPPRKGPPPRKAPPGPRKDPGPYKPPVGPTLPKPQPKPPVNHRPINDNDRPFAQPNPIDFFTDTIVAVGTAAVSTVVVEGAAVVAGTATTVGAGVVAGTAALVEIADDLLTEPQAEPDPRGKPLPGTDTSGDCRSGFGGGWRRYSPVDVANGSRATGAEACLTKEFVEANKGGKPEVQPPAYIWAAIYASDLGDRPAKIWRNACHLLAASLGGEGTVYENLATCSRTANAWRLAGPPHHTENMEAYEKQVRDALKPGVVVHYTVEPKYDGQRVVPTEFHMKATKFTPGVGTEPLFDASVPNDIFSLKDQQWHNMGKDAPTEWVP